jgi:CBS domain-containing protein
LKVLKPEEEKSMKARDIMTANPRCVTTADSITRAAEIMRDTDVGIVPVVEDSGSMRLAGVVTDRDIAVRIVAEGRGNDVNVREVMSSGLATVRPDDDLDRVTELMKSEQVRRIPVVDGDRLVGIIAQADVAREGRDKKTGDVVEHISEPSRGR